MLTAKKALAAARVYTQETAQEMGALKGAPCTIKSIVKSGNLNTVTFEWTDRSEVTHESTMLVYDGTDGQDGDDGFSPTIVVKSSTSTEYILTITDKNGSYDTPNLKGGGGGGGGASSLSDLDDIALSSLANGDVLVYDSTAGKWKNVQLDIPTQLSDLSDIDLASLADADILKFDFANQKWVNGKLDYSELTGTPTLGTAAAKDSTNAVTQGSSELLESGGAYTALDGKVDKVTGKGLSTNDFTDAEKQKLDNMELDDLADVDMTGISDGQILAWNDANSKMVPADQTGTEYTAGMGVDISAQNEISTEFIMYPGTKAEWDQLPVSEKIKYTHTAWNDSQSGIVDNLPTQNSDNLVKSGGVWTGLDAKADKTALTDYQTKDLATPITVDGTSETTVEGALGAINTLAAGNKTDKADKVSSATNGDFAGLDASGNLTDSGKKASDFATAQGLADEAATRSYMGAKNLLRFPYETTSYSILTVEDDGGLTLDGTPTTDFWIAINNNTSDVHPYVLPAGRYIFSCKRVGNVAITLGVRTIDGDVSLASMYFGNEDYIESTFELAEATDLKVRGFIGANTACDGTIYPMIRLATDADTTYQLYAKTNKELTDEVSANTSGLADEISTRSQLGAHNLNIYPYKNGKAGDVWSTNGIDFTVNSDGSITANGTATADAYFRCGISTDDTNPIHLVSGKKYILSGSGQANVSVRLRNSSNTGVANATTSEAVYECSSTGSYYILLEVPSGITVDNLTIYPMLRLATDSDSTYEPYAKSNQVITEDFQTMYKNNGILGVKNLLPTPYYSTKGGTTTSGTLTVTENADGSVTIDGTASGQSYIDLARNDKFLKAGTYILSGGITSKQYVYINCLNNGTYVKTLASAMTSEVKFVLDYNGYDAITVGISIASGESLSNVTFYPMIRLASDTDTTYQPYAKTNRELTVDSVSWKNNALLGAKNLIPNLGASRTIGGCTITVNSDGSFTIVQDSTVSSQTFELFNDANNPIELKAPCILSSGADLSNSQLIATIDGTDYYAHENDKTPIVPAGSLTRVRYYFNSSYTGTRTVYPMLRYAFDTDPTYVPYAMTNRQLSAYEKGNITYSIQATETAMTTIIKVGKVVQCNMMAAIGEAVSAWTTFATIPEGFRPAFYVQAVNNKTMYTGFNIVQISPQGTVQSASALASGDRLRFTAVWILP